jgi:hypothetical protein
MATRRDSTSPAKRSEKTAKHSVKPVSSERYPEWKVQLFRAGIAERRNSIAGQVGGRAMRAPGA